ncbi:MAG: tRNA 2-thiouridine(34) synthase MnmA [Pseudomonadota bacterium]
MLNSLDLTGAPEGTRVVVAMSGGVDSSVVAALLKREGYDVIGMTMQLYDHGEAVHRKGACCAGQDIHDAKRVAEALNIPHYVLNYEEKFRQSVIDPFTRSYIEGETPIPCVACNQTVKFSDLLTTAKELGADALATGHYIDSRKNGKRRSLHRPADSDRDQSYFLFATTQEQIDFLRFPLGSIGKDAVREIARELGLIVAEKSDSQDICFVPKGRYSDVISRLNPNAAEPGDVVHINGEVLGRHEGIIHYTIGQRRGLGVAAGAPLYVIHLDASNAKVIVGPREALETRRLILRDVNWLADAPLSELPADGIELFVKVRSTRPPAAARLFSVDNKAVVELAVGEDGIARGQACVFYEDERPQTRILGGGWLERAEKAQITESAIRAITDCGQQVSASI